MKIDFHKYHGTGNDFIIIHNPDNHDHLSQEDIAKLCHRQYGIGADGLMLLSPSHKSDFHMKYFNADGYEGSMCGNGARCIAAFASDMGLISSETLFSAVDGDHRAYINKVSEKLFHVRVTLADVESIKHLSGSTFFINTGSPHYVQFVDDLESIDAFVEGNKIRWEKRFQPEGTNVNFVQLTDESIIVKTFERGVENLTLSCGTGVTASAIAASLMTGQADKKWEVLTSGGTLSIQFNRTKNQRFTNVLLEGPAEKVFQGKTSL